MALGALGRAERGFCNETKKLCWPPKSAKVEEPFSKPGLSRFINSRKNLLKHPGMCMIWSLNPATLGTLEVLLWVFCIQIQNTM